MTFTVPREGTRFQEKWKEIEEYVKHSGLKPEEGQGVIDVLRGPFASSDAHSTFQEFFLQKGPGFDEVEEKYQRAVAEWKPCRANLEKLKALPPASLQRIQRVIALMKWDSLRRDLEEKLSQATSRQSQGDKAIITSVIDTVERDITQASQGGLLAVLDKNLELLSEVDAANAEFLEDFKGVAPAAPGGAQDEATKKEIKERREKEKNQGRLSRKSVCTASIVVFTLGFGLWGYMSNLDEEENKDKSEEEIDGSIAGAVGGMFVGAVLGTAVCLGYVAYDAYNTIDEEDEKREETYKRWGDWDAP